MEKNCEPPPCRAWRPAATAVRGSGTAAAGLKSLILNG